MFTGIITGLGRVTAFDRVGDQVAAIVLAPYNDVKIGESIAVNGVCLTVVPTGTSDMTALNAGGNITGSVLGSNRLHFFISPETLDRSNLGDLKVGDQVNLERALLATDRLSGHMVQGHVDGRAKIVKVGANPSAPDSYLLEVKVPESMLPLLVEKGSIALDGVSLTVNSIKDSVIYITLIPHTWAHTALHLKQVGQDLNVELDVIAKYLRQWASPYLK